MPTLRQLKRRITSVRNTAKITNALQLVAASKMRRAQDRALQARPRVTDSVEVVLAGEHIGLVYLIEDEGETSYQLEMTILQEDLDG